MIRVMSEVVSLDEFLPGVRPGGDDTASERNGSTRDVFFERAEFHQILNLYGMMVAKGEWRDYALCHDRDACVFAVFRRTSEGALYRIVKTPALARRQGAFSVLAANGRVLKRGHSLDAVLKLFAKARFATV